MHVLSTQASSDVSLGHQTCWRERGGRHLEGKGKEREEKPKREGGSVGGGGGRGDGDGEGERRGEWAGLGYALQL